MKTYRVHMKDGGSSFVVKAESEAEAKRKAVVQARQVAQVVWNKGCTSVSRVEVVQH